MARDIATIKQNNLWGKAADSGLGLEPQRSDLYVLDFTTAQKGVAQASNQRLSDVLPQFVRSISPPELRTKAEPIRRDSVPFQMPSWDDPLDPIKVAFLLDTSNEDDKSAVIQFLDAWLALTRAGRGSRFQGYSSTGWLTLDANYRVNYTYNVSLFLLRGAALNFGTGASGQDQGPLNTYLANANAMFRNAKKRLGLVQTGAPLSTADPSTANILAQLAQRQPNAATTDQLTQDVVIHSIYILSNAWLGGYKLSDFSYAESNLTTVEATFYADSMALATRSSIFGAALLPASG
jgi:hypothetical protein